MTYKEWFLLKGELDYCIHMLNDLVKALNMTQSKAMQSPINSLIDNACGFEEIDWITVALILYWCEQVISRKKKLDITYDATETLRKGLEVLMKNSGKEEFYYKVVEEINNEVN